MMLLRVARRQAEQIQVAASFLLVYFMDYL
jgi:hypothetical protein